MIEGGISRTIFNGLFHINRHFRVKGQIKRYGPLGVVLRGTSRSVLNEPPEDGRRPRCLQAAARQFTLLPWVAEIQAHDREIDEVI